MASRTYITKKLMLISTQYASRDEFCLEACIRFLLGDSNLATSVVTDQLRGLFIPGSLSAESGRSSESHDALSPKVLESDSSSSESEIGLGSEINVLTRHVGNNVPYPCLCGARFSITGILVYFQSPIPHPATSKFSSLVPSTRRMQPILQTQQIQPKSFPSYGISPLIKERYRSFLLSKYPRRTNTHNIEIRDRLLNFMFEDDEEISDEDAEPSRLFLRGSKHEDFSMYNFLLKLAERKKDSDIPVTSLKTLNTMFFVGDTKSKIKLERKSSVSSNNSLSDKEWSDDVLLSQHRNSSPEILSRQDDKYNLKKPNNLNITRAIRADKMPHIRTSSDPGKFDFSNAISSTGFGTVVYLKEISHLLPINKSLAEVFT
jgi:hypothetical protein